MNDIVERLRKIDEELAPDPWSGEKDFKRERAKLHARGLCREAAATIESLQADVERKDAALNESKEALQLGADIPASDPRCREEVVALCRRFGFGAVMSTASVEWRNELNEIAGGEFCAGPCRGTAEKVIAEIDQALSPT